MNRYDRKHWMLRGFAVSALRRAPATSDLWVPGGRLSPTRRATFWLDLWSLLGFYGFTTSAKSMSDFNLASGMTPSSSAGSPERFTQWLVNPKTLAPATSKKLEETNPILPASTPIFFTASWYAAALGLNIFASRGRLMT